MKKITAVLICAVMIMGLMPALGVSAATSGTCGDNLTWKYSDGTLTISGTGSMQYSTQPWFQQATLITSVIVNEGAISIGYEAFRGCVNLTRVSLPNSLTSIGDNAFLNCSSLRSLYIPDSVASIGMAAFAYCSALSSVTLPSKLSSVSYGTFDSCVSLKNVSIQSGVTSIGQNAFARCSSLKHIYYAGTKEAWNNISIGSQLNSSFGNATIHYKSVIVNDNPLGILSAVMVRDGKSYNILTTTQSFEKSSTESVSINVTVNWGSLPSGRIIISQSAVKYIENTSGNFTSVVPGTAFDTGDAIYIIAVDGDGDILETKKTCLRVTEPVTQSSSGGDATISLFDAFSFTIPDDKPVLGNQTFKLDLGKIDVELEMDDGSFKAVLGVNFEKGDDGKFDAADFKTLKTTINDAKDKIKKGKSISDIQAAFKKAGLIGKVSNFTIKSGWKPEASVAGYIEGTIDSEGNLIPTEGGMIVTASLKYSYQGQAFVVVVPVYYSISAGGSIKATFGIKGMVVGEGFSPMFSGDLVITPSFEIGGGLGVVYLGQVGARGSVTLPITIALDDDYRKVQLKGSAYFEITALSFKLYEKEFASGTWTIYETGRASTSSLMGEAEDIYALIDINAQATPEDRSYLDSPSVWLGEDVPMSLMEADYTNKEIRVLEENAYPDAMPQIMSVDGKKVLIWITDNAERSDENKSMLVYSLYDDESDTWAEPIAVMDDGTADFYPQAVGKYVVWQKASEEFEEGVSLAEVGAKSDIYIAEFNGEGFGTPVRLTENDVLDAQPTVAVDGDAAAVIWTENSDNNILGYSGENSILISEFDGAAWSEPEALAEGLNTVASISAGYMEGELVIAYSYDEDNDLNTIDDREIYIIRGGETTRFTENETLDSNPKFAAINGETALFWYNEGNIYYTTDVEDVVISSVSAEGINALSDDYCVFSNGNSAAVIWTSLSDGVSEVYGALYDGLQWSCDVEITQEGEFVKYPSGIIEDDGKLIIAFNRTENVEDGDYYTDGKSDLCVMGVTPSYDIAVSDAYLAEGIEPNAENTVYVTLTNNGELPIEGVTASVYDVDGTLNGEYTFDTYLQPGESEELEVYYVTGGEITPGEVTIKAALSDGEEYDETNNEALLTVGESDLEITSVATETAGVNHTVTVTLQNSGYSTAENAVAEIRENGESGSLLAKKYIGDIAPQEERTVTFTIDERGIPTENSFVILSAAAETDSEEVSRGNNYESFTIDLSAEKAAAAWSCAIDDVCIEEGKVNVTLSGEIEGKITAASFASDGTLIAAAVKDAAEDGETELPLDMTGAAYVKVFVWSEMEPQSLSAEIDWNN